MTPSAWMGDLIVLVSDADMMRTVTALLARPQALGTAKFEFAVEQHPRKDPGCRGNAANVLRRHLTGYRHSMVMFDYHGCGSTEPRERIQATVEDQLARNGWSGRAKAIVIEPELEAWMWGDLASAAKNVGWTGRQQKMRSWLARNGLWPKDQPKPPSPKEALEAVVGQAPRGRLVRRHPRMYQAIAEAANVDHCRDPAFQELVATLRRWFPPEEAPGTPP